MQSHSFQRLRNVIYNVAGGWKINQIPDSSIYAKAASRSFHLNTMKLRASIHEAAKSFENVVEELVSSDRLYYDLTVLEKEGPRVKVRDRQNREYDLLDLVTNSYNDLEHYEETRTRLVDLVSKIQLSSCISRRIAGNHSTHYELGKELADFLGYESCVLGTCGYISQISTMFALFKKGDVIFSDQMNHSSIVDGCKLSNAKIIVFKHRDYNDLERLLKKYRNKFNGAGIVSDGVFSTKGATANIDKIVALSQQYNCLSVVDDTHGVTSVGKTGRGCIEVYNSKPDVLTGGFGKAFGAFGGFAVASKPLCEVISMFGRQNVNTSHMSPVMAGQALINLRYYREHLDEVQGQLLTVLRAFNDELGKYGIQSYPDPDYIHPIFCFYKKSETETLICFKELVKEGFLPSFFPPPVAPYPSLRFSLHRLVPVDEVIRLAQILGKMDLVTDPGNLG